MKLRLTATLFVLACACAPGALAQAPDYPAKPVRVLVGFTAGGATDVVARIVAQRLGDNLGQSFVVDNRPGASGMIAAELTAKAPPDGYTLSVASQTVLAVVPAMHSKPLYDPLRDFAQITVIGASPMMLVVHPSVPVDSVAKLIALARARPGQLTYATGGNGTTPHMSGALFTMMAGIDLVMVPYKGEAPGVTDLLAGQVSMMFSNVPIVLPHVRAGKLRGLAVTGAQRVASAPDIPTVAESGLPGYQNETWFSLFAPAATPRELIAKLNAETVRAMGAPDVKEKLAAQGIFIVGSTVDACNVFVRDEIVKWAKVVKQTGARAD